MKFLLSLFALALGLGGAAQYFQAHNIFSGEVLEHYDFQEFDGHLYYTGNDLDGSFNVVLHRTNGSIGNGAVQSNSDGEIMEVQVNFGEHLGGLYFSGTTGNNTVELWRISGANEDPVQMTTINDPAPFGTPIFREMRSIGSSVLFDVNQEVGENTGKELWISDGTPDGTELFLDINPNGDGFEFWVGRFNDILYFSADNGVDGYELWRTDGTTAGTYMLKDIDPIGDGIQGEGIVFNNRLFFTASTPEQGREIWTTDGTEEGTQIFMDLNPGSGGSPDFNPQFTILNNRLYFVATDGNSGRELWSTDGTPEGTEQVADLAAGGANATILNITPFNNRLYFGYAQQGSGDLRHLWATDGTESGTVMIAPGAYIDNPRDMYEVDGELVFLINGASSRELWRTDGTDNGTYEILPAGLDDEWQILGDGHFEVFGGRLFVDAALNGDADMWSYGAGEISLSTSSVKEVSHISAYPNPSTDIVFLDVSGVQSGRIEIEVYDQIGRKVYREGGTREDFISLSKQKLGKAGLFIARVLNASTGAIMGEAKFVIR
jgi:ELWxxDGT repeat protein